MLTLCSMLSGTYYAHNYASIISGSLDEVPPCRGLFPVIGHTFLVYKKPSTQGTITRYNLNKLDVKNHWVLRDLENPQALSSALTALGRYSPGTSSFLTPVEPWFLMSNYYLGGLSGDEKVIKPFRVSEI